MSRAEEVALLPCPFCGSGNARGPGNFTNASFSGVELLQETSGRYYVQCGTCGSQALGSFHKGCAINNWNTRAGETQND